jgi:hypothetical protein
LLCGSFGLESKKIALHTDYLRQTPEKCFSLGECSEALDNVVRVRPFNFVKTVQTSLSMGSALASGAECLCCSCERRFFVDDF